MLNLPIGLRCGEIVYDRANLGVLSLAPPLRYSVFEQTGLGGIFFPQLSSDARNFLLEGLAPDNVAVRGDGLIRAGNQRFTQLPGFFAVAIPPRVVTNLEVVHTGAPSQTADLLAQLKVLVPDWFP